MHSGRSICKVLFRLAASVFVSSAVCAAIPLAAQSGNSPVTTGYESTTSTSLRAAGRILNQTTFGPTVNSIGTVENMGIPAFVDSQLNQPAFLMPLTIPQADYSNSSCSGWSCDVEGWWWEDAIFGQDQLRQRVAYALSKLFVVSYTQVDARYYPYYMNQLSADAFGNWFDLMQDVALSGAMGTYLNSANSPAPDAGGHADENFARELMQLFSIGTVALNRDGTPKLDGQGNTIPNYTPAIVQSFARAYTGYTFANADCSVPTQPKYYWWPLPPGAACPMVPLEQYHDHTQKTLLRGQVLPSGQSASDDFTAALQNVFQDPSLPPFVCRRLIQALVRSNPSPAYISRIAGVFINDGSGTRGNLKAVIRAILLDSEARAADVFSNTDSSAGVMRDPIMWWISILRTLQATQLQPVPYDGVYSKVFDVWLRDLGEASHGAPSVFSFYSPDYTVNGGALVAPEFQLENTFSISWMMLHAQDMIDSNYNPQKYTELGFDLSASSPLGVIAANQGPGALLDVLSAVMMQGSMTADMRSSMMNVLNGLDPATMVRDAVDLIVTSPQYRIMI